MTVEGVSAQLRYGYYEAAQLGRWVLASSGRQQMTLRARVVSLHALWGRRAQLDLVLTLGATEWRWEAITPVYEGEDVVVELTAHPQVSNFAVMPSTLRGNR